MSLKMQQTGIDRDYRAVKYSQGGVLAGAGGRKEKWKERKEPFFLCRKGMFTCVKQSLTCLLANDPSISLPEGVANQFSPLYVSVCAAITWIQLFYMQIYLGISSVSIDMI